MQTPWFSNIIFQNKTAIVWFLFGQILCGNAVSPPWERIAPIVFFIYRQNQIKIIVQHSYSVKISCALNKRDQADLSLPYGAAN